MDDNRQIKVNHSIYRKRRVKRIKRTIIIMIVIILVLPLIFCAYLLRKVDKLENKIEEISYIKQQMDDKEDTGKSGGTQVKAAENNEGDEPEAVENTPSVEEENHEAMGRNVETNKKEKKKVYLTFDDGPSVLTPSVLDILKEEEVKATFFVIGKENDMAKELYKRIVEEGHTLGMHSFSHQYVNIYKSTTNFKKDLTRISNLLYETTGIKPKYYRFPGGSSTTRNKVSINKCIDILEKNKIKYFDWNVINGDAESKAWSDKKMVNSVINKVKSYDTSIVLMHDAMDKQATVRTLPTIIKKLKKGNYDILPIDDTTNQIKHLR